MSEGAKSGRIFFFIYFVRFCLTVSLKFVSVTDWLNRSVVKRARKKNENKNTNMASFRDENEEDEKSHQKCPHSLGGRLSPKIIFKNESQ